LGSARFDVGVAKLSVADHLFAVLFVIAFPIAGMLGFRRLRRQAAAGQRVDRLQLYRNTIVGHWSLFAIALVIWVDAGRAWSALGIAYAGYWRFLLAAALSLIVLALLIAQQMRVARLDQAAIDKIGRQFGQLELLIPRNGAELLRFNVVAVTAGVVEEVLWRGFLIWYLGNLLPIWLAAMLSAIGFGIAHAYQGAAQIPKITIVGALFVVLYLLSGSIWLPIIMHAAIDLLQGRLGYEILRRRNPATQAVSS